MNAPEPLMNEDFLYEHEKQSIEKRKNEAIAKRDSKKLHKLEQQEMILEQERSDQLWLEELQKLQIAAEQELIRQLEDQKRAQEAIAALAEEYKYQNTCRKRWCES